MKLYCPDCGERMEWKGYRPLFPTCSGCGSSFHVSKCVRESSSD